MTALRRRLWRVVAAGTIVILLAIGVWFVRRVMEGVSVIRHAYTASHARFLATQAVEKYVRERGKWPTSWEDLESASAKGSANSLPPGGWDEIRTYVEINFNVTLDDVAKQRVEQFDAIKAKGPVRGPGDFYSLLETVRRVHGARAGPSSP